MDHVLVTIVASTGGHALVSIKPRAKVRVESPYSDAANRAVGADLLAHFDQSVYLRW